MPVVNTADGSWPSTPTQRRYNDLLDNDLLMANGETAVTGMALEQVDDAIEELIAIGSDPIASCEDPAISGDHIYMP